MTEPQRKIQPALKRKIIEKAGGKCANPGCSNWRVHIHHIKHWALYKSHNAADMIALCPSCHDAVHHGQLKISEELLYEWKAANRPATPDSVQLHIEPAQSLKLLTGTVAVSTTSGQVVVFQLSNTNHLKVRILDQDILLVSSRLLDRRGSEILRVVENHVRVTRDERVSFACRAGHARISMPIDERFLSPWMLEQIQASDPALIADERIVAMDIQVLKAGLARVQGCWADENSGVLITEKKLTFFERGRVPMSISGEGENSVLLYSGPLTQTMFQR
jgi:hypothetical protein